MKTAFATLVLVLVGSMLYADPLSCNLSAYRAIPGLSAAMADNALTVTWDGDHNQELRLRLGIAAGTPTIQDLARIPSLSRVAI